MKLFDQIFNEVVTPFLEPRIKKTSLKAVKAYVAAIQTTRKVALASFALGATSAILVTGILLMVIAIIGLLPIDPQAVLITMLVIGAVLTLAAGFVTIAGFRESVWLEKSKANDLMEAAIRPWESAYAVPDPRRVFTQPKEAQRSYDENQDLAATARQTQPVYGTRAPQAAYPSMNTPDAALTSRPIDTTAVLHP